MHIHLCMCSFIKCTQMCTSVFFYENVGENLEKHYPIEI